MSLTNKVAQFDADSDLVNAWVHGPASGAGSSITTDSGTVRSPAKLIADLDASINVDADGVLAQATTMASTATTQASIATTQAQLATTNGATQVALATAQAGLATTNGAAQVTLATAQKDLAVTAKTAAELAAVNALISAGSYTTEALGRAAVADGVAFKVQGSGDVAAYEYRKDVGGLTSTLIATYPSITAVNSVFDTTRVSLALPNLFTQSQLSFETLALPISGTLARNLINGVPHLKGLNDASGAGRFYYRIPVTAEMLLIGKFCAQVTINNVSAGTTGAIKLLQRNGAGTTIVTTTLHTIISAGISTASTFSVASVVLDPTCTNIDFDCVFNAAAATSREINITGMQLCSGTYPGFRQPLFTDYVTSATKLHATEELGRASVVNGATFRVVGAGTTAWYEYTRVSSTTSVLVTAYPSADIPVDAVRNTMAQPNLFSRAQLLAQVMPNIFVSGTVAADSVDGLPTIKLTSPVTTEARYAWRFDRSLIAGTLVSASIVIAKANLGASANYVRIICRNSAGSQLSSTSALNVDGSAITNSKVISLSGVVIPALCTFIDFDVMFTASPTEPKEIHLRGMYLGAGVSATYRAPDEVAALLTSTESLQLADTAKENSIVALQAQVALVSSTVALVTPSYFGRFTGFPTRVANRLAGSGLSLSQEASGAVSFGFNARNEASLSLTKTTYYFSPTGSDSNSGLTRNLPKKALGVFIAALVPTTDIEIILIGSEPSVYFRDDSLPGAIWDKPYHLSIVAEREALLTSAEPVTSLSWSAVGASWQCTRTAVNSVFDAAFLDYRGIPYRLRLVGSVAAVQAEAGTWYTDGTLLTVRLHDSRSPDSNLLPMLNTGRFTCTVRSGKTVYFENIKFGLFGNNMEAVRVLTDTGDTGYLTQKNCAFFAGHRNGLSAIQVTRVYSENCTAAHNGYDGFNYHDNIAAPQSTAVEAGCHSYDNGLVGGTGTNNGSTAHDGMTMLRVGGLYYNTNGPVVADVNGCVSFNINCTSAKSVLSGSGNTVASWYFDNAAAIANGEAWLVGCKSHDSLYDISSDGAAINVRGWQGGVPVLGPLAVITKF